MRTTRPIPLARLPRLALAALTLVALAGCYAPINSELVRPTVPVSRSVPQATLEKAVEAPDEDVLPAIAELLGGLRLAHDRLAAGDGSAAAEYNYLTARLVGHLRAAKVKPWQNQLEVPGGRTRYVLRGTQPDDLDAEKRLFVPADALEFTGRYAVTRASAPGVGAPLVAVLPGKRSMDERFDDLFRYRNVTAAVHFEGNSVTVDLLDPFEDNSVRIGPHRYPLHSDFSASTSQALSKERIDKLGLARLLNPEKFSTTARLSRVQPYDPDRIPVLMVHGLQDTPASFLPMYLTLMDDPKIRENYQFWVFSYPSGYPYPYSASLLRAELDRMKRQFPGHRDIVIIGHSMGGLLTRLMVTDSGDRIWRGYFGKPPAETPVGGATREALERALIFEHRPEIDRAIFFSAPHRGSEIASNWIGRLGSRLVRAPSFIADVRDTVSGVMTADASALQLSRAPNSIDTLAPNDRFILEINKIPLHPGIPYHSVMGDRGKGDTPDSSDGVVAYWSSHLEGAESERIVPSDHSSHQHPEGIAEARRILRLHAGLDR